VLTRQKAEPHLIFKKTCTVANFAKMQGVSVIVYRFVLFFLQRGPVFEAFSSLLRGNPRDTEMEHMTCQLGIDMPVECTEHKSLDSAGLRLHVLRTLCIKYTNCCISVTKFSISVYRRHGLELQGTASNLRQIPEYRTAGNLPRGRDKDGRYTGTKRLNAFWGDEEKRRRDPSVC
jgi:hypothetical protein